MNFKDQFPILANYTYLDTASSGILSRSIIDWRRSHDEDFMQNGSRFRFSQGKLLQEARESVARFFHTKAENTYLIPNFSIGFNTFLDGLSTDHRFLLINSDYPSINYPVQSRGFSCEYAEPNEFFEQNILSKIESFKPSILVFSLVQYTSGIKIDLDFLKTIKREYPHILIVADGTQFCGTEDFNFETSGLDVLIASGYKWMLSGYGNGFILLKDTVCDQLYQSRRSSLLPTEPFLQDKNILSLCFEPGHLDTLNFGTLKQSISFFEEIGFDLIQKRIQSISKLAKVAFTERGLLSKEVMLRSNHSSIFNIKANEALAKRLTDAKIAVTPRGKGLRLAFHFYNDEEDLQHLLEVLDRN